jgi:hypothetical protein
VQSRGINEKFDGAKTAELGPGVSRREEKKRLDFHNKII